MALNQNSRCNNDCCKGNELLCISIPEPITIVVLGNTLRLELPCLRLTSEDSLSGEEASTILAALTRILGAAGAIIENEAPQA